ncbi:sensor histidine kinase [Psychrobacillus sp. FJAT-51614]|uniref:histidine kinase n=1 Tax=Psychrobacillus mangrovi TaxID=3117745 RepID=A0ABU8F1R5_9BACI
MNVSAKKSRVTLLTQMTLLIIVVVLLSTLLVSILFSRMLDDIVEKNMGQQAMTVAKLTAQNPTIIEAFDDANPSKSIQPISEIIRQTSGADYVTVANEKGLRYSHPNPKNIGKPTATSNDPVLQDHESIIYRGSGISGPAIKAKTPIWNSKGEVIGVSSVGFLVENIEQQVQGYRKHIIQLAIIPLIVGIGGAILIARRLKKLTFGLEPEEISFLFTEKEATIESIRDATITVNNEKRITSMNKRARELFDEQQLIIGSVITDNQLESYINDAIETKGSFMNKKLMLDQQFYVLDTSPIVIASDVKGVVLTIRAVSEIEQLTEEFSKIKTFSENMRAQNHEFLNKLNTIYGLLTLKEYDRAIKIVSSEVSERQDIISFLMSSVKDPLIAACLLGKMNRSKELQVSLEIDPDSRLDSVLDNTMSNHFVPIIGNIIENAMEAARKKGEHKGKVKVSFTDLGKEIIFDIEDNGQGIPIMMEDIIFKDGYTTKSGENHGIGLAIVKNSIGLLNGQIYVDKSELGGARFTIVIPQNS